MKKPLVILLVMAVFTTLLGLACQVPTTPVPGPAPAAAPAQPQPVTLRIQASFPAASVLYDPVLRLKDMVEKMSGGRLQIEAFPAGAVVGAFEVLDATHKGLLDGAVTCSYYFIGKHRALALFTDVPGGPYGMNTIDFWGWYYEGGGFELEQELYQKVLGMNVVVFPIFATTPQALGWFNKPIRSAADLKGLKMRAPGLPGEVYKEMGLAIVTLPGGEVVPALERGTIDAAEWYTPGEDLRMGFQDVAKFYYIPTAHETAGMCELQLNKDKWDSLSPDLQEIIKTATLAVAFRNWMWVNRLDAEALRDMETKYGVRVSRTPDDIIIEYLRTWDRMAEEEAAKDPFFKKVLESQRDYAALVVPARLKREAYDFIARYYWEK